MYRDTKKVPDSKSIHLKVHTSKSHFSMELYLLNKGSGGVRADWGKLGLSPPNNG